MKVEFDLELRSSSSSLRSRVRVTEFDFESEFELESSNSRSSSRVRGRVRVQVRVEVAEFELRTSLRLSLSLRVRTQARVGALEIEFNVEFEFALGRPEERCQTPPGNVPAGTLGAHPRGRPEAPGRDPEKEDLEELVNNARAVGVSSLKCRVGHIGSIAQSPSHSLSHPLKGMASQQLQLAVAGSQCELP